MFKNLTNAKLGIFIFIGSSLLVILIFLLGNKDQLFASTFEVNAFFKDTGGLRNGASVRFGGIDVGAVKSISISGEQSGNVRVSMRVLTDIKKFIKKDSRASIETEGLVGNKVVILTMGSDEADEIADGGTILSREPLSFASVIEETQGIMAYTKEMTKNIAEIVKKVNEGEGTIGKIINDDELYTAATNITKSADVSLTSITDNLKEVIAVFDKLGKGMEDIVVNVNNITLQVDTLLKGVSEGNGIMGSLLTNNGNEGKSIKQILDNIVVITEDAKVSAARLSENMEALKHNWLFKSYFEERGYWEAEEYEKEIDRKTKELNEKIDLLDKKIEELKSLQSNSN